MSYTNFRTVAPGEVAKPQTGNEKDIRSRQIDELIALSEDARRDAYGPNSDTDNRNLYMLFERTRKMPTFRPRIAAPQLQILLLNEAAELTDANIRVFIHKGDNRDKAREDAFKQHWRQNFFSLQLLMAQVYAQFSGTSFLEVGNDPLANQGRGNVWTRARLQSKVHCDPSSWWPPDWTWQVLEQELQLDEIKQHYGRVADKIRPRGAKTKELAGPPAGRLEMPPGPMSETIRGLQTSTEADYDTGGPLTVRRAFICDTTLRELDKQEKLLLESKKLPVPDYVPRFPLGRMVVDCEGTILSDGQSWLPLGEMWPAIPVWALPPWDNVWCPPPPKYTKSLQDAAEQQMTQSYENARRLNNGVIVIHASTGLTANSVGGLAGEILVVNANSPPGQGIDIKYPNAFPPGMIELPFKYLSLQKELRGHTAARQGNLNPGNVGPDLFESAVSLSQTGTRLTGKLFAWSVQKLCELLFYTMGHSFTEQQVFFDKGKKFLWEPDTEHVGDYRVQLPEGAIRPMSQTALRSMVIELKKAGMMDVRHALDMLDVPESEEIAEAVENELKLAALARTQRR